MLPQNKRPPDIKDYVNATSLDMALRALADGNATPLAGGSDLWAQKDAGVRPIRDRLVNLSNVDELAGITETDGVVRLGARVTMSAILASDLAARHAGMLVETANRFASVQIRNVATIGGNIANASPAGDMALALLALGAVAEVASFDGTIVSRKVPLGDMFAGPGRINIGANELLVAVEFASQAGRYGTFQKSGTRPALEISMASMCLGGRVENGALHDPAIAFGAVGPTPLRCPKTEQLIDGKPLDDALIAAALDTMAGEISPIDDFRASKWYRMHMAKTFLEQELITCRSL